MIEIVYRWPDGREEVRYRRSSAAEARGLVQEVVALKRAASKGGWECRYYVRRVKVQTVWGPVPLGT